MPAGKPATPLCEQFGFDAEWRDAQLTLIGLDGAYVRCMCACCTDKLLSREAVAARIIGQFYAQLLLNPQAAGILLSSFDIGALETKADRLFK